VDKGAGNTWHTGQTLAAVVRAAWCCVMFIGSAVLDFMLFQAHLRWLKTTVFFERWEGQTLSGWPHTQQPSKPSCRGPKAKPHTRSSRRHAAPFQEVPSKNSLGVEPTHLLGVLQLEAAHTRLTEASRPNKGVRKAAQEQESSLQRQSPASHSPTLHLPSQQLPRNPCRPLPLPPPGPNLPSSLSRLSVAAAAATPANANPSPTPVRPRCCCPSRDPCYCWPRGSRQGSSCHRPLVLADPAAAAAPGAAAGAAAALGPCSCSDCCCQVTPHCLRGYQPDRSIRHTLPKHPNRRRHPAAQVPHP
jgi:hypothetical protein